MNKMKHLIGYHYSQFVKPLVISFSIFFIFTLGLTSITLRTTPNGMDPNLLIQMDFWGTNTISLLLMGIIASLFHIRSNKNLSQNGFTRTQIYVSKLFAMILLSLTMVALNIITQLIQMLVFKINHFSSGLNSLKYFSVLFLIYILIGIVFTFFAIVVDKFGVKYSFLFYIGVVIGSRLINPIINTLVSKDQQTWIMNNIFGFIPTGELPPQYLFIPFSIMAVITTIISYVIFKRTDIVE